MHGLQALTRWMTAALMLPALALPSISRGASVVRTEQVRAELIAHAPQGIGPGKEVWLGLRLEHIPHWHTYWKNAGDSGLPTSFASTLPAGASAGDIDWPTPRQLPIGPLLNFGYEDVTVLPVPVTIASSFAGPDLHVRLEADWLVCKIECIPQSGTFDLDVPVDRATTAHAADFERALAARPRTVNASADARVDGDALSFTIDGLAATLQGRKAVVFPEVAGVVDNPAAVEQNWHGELWKARWPLSAQRSESPARFPLVLAFDDGSNVRVVAQVTSAWPGAQDAVAAAAPATNREAASLEPLGFAAALLFALLGGVILNLMPCVFPVLSLKVLSLVQHPGGARERWTSALAYTAGVVLAFLALAGLLIAARAGGEQLGWGFQLQSPPVVAALAALFTLIGLNLAGVFEFGSLLPSGIASLEARHPVANSFLTGVLAVAVASPCTAPFMGASIGYAIGLPGPAALAIFAALGIGMALPYLAASWVPAVARALPRPGAWMDTFRRLMAFPMFATVAWLVWVLGQQSGIDGAGALLALLVGLSMLVWALTLRGRSRLAVSALALA